MANFYGSYIGYGSGDLAAVAGAGFTSGGDSGSDSNVIDKHTFADDSTCVDHGDLGAARKWVGGHSATDYGFTVCGQTPITNIIQKWPFAGTGVSTSSAGTLSYSRRGCTGVSNAGDQYGYTMGGWTGSSVSGTMDVYNMANTSGSFATATLSSARYGSGGSESSIRGYITGGGPSTTIDMIVFASFTTGVTEGRALYYSTAETQSTNSETHSYTMGGQNGSLGSTAFDAIQKFSFADTNNATKTGVLTRGRTYGSTFHSTDYGYICGGYTPTTDTSEKMAFASDTETESVGTLTVPRDSCAGHQSLTL